jgi:putative SOS response-associated peptidase YedK
MCGRYASSRPPEIIADEHDAEIDTPALPPSWNVAPTMPVYAVLEREGTRRLRALRWGLVPSWADDLAIGSRLINARAETVEEKPAFRAALASRRCVVPADGYYEWLADGGRKTPFYIHRPDGTALAFAGLYEVWRDPAEPESPLVWSCTIVTTAASENLAQLHDRMPVVLPDAEAVTRWLAAPDLDLLAPTSGRQLAAHPVGPRVSDVRQDGPDLVLPVPAEPPPLTLF